MTQKHDGGPAYPQIGVFKTDAPIVLEMAPNGGWVVSQGDDPRCIPNRIGAYSSAEHMLDALSSALHADLRDMGVE
jgi:hypothetical protein